MRVALPQKDKESSAFDRAQGDRPINGWSSPSVPRAYPFRCIDELNALVHKSPFNLLTSFVATLTRPNLNSRLARLGLLYVGQKHDAYGTGSLKHDRLAAGQWFYAYPNSRWRRRNEDRDTSDGDSVRPLT
jgi:hypothetical protein